MGTLSSLQKETRDKIRADTVLKNYPLYLNMDENSMAYVHLTKDDLLGSYQWQGGLDLLNIVLIGISDKIPEHDDKYELHCLLSTLFSMELTAIEKLEIIETEYSIILNMHKKGYTSEQIAEVVEKTIDEVEVIIKKREPVLA